MGLRRGEVLALRWSDVDLDHGRVHVAAQLVVESGRSRLKPLDDEHGRRCVPVTPALVTMLARHRRARDGERASAGDRWSGNDLVFATPTGRWITPDRFGAVLDDLVRVAGVPRATSEALRRMGHSVGGPGIQTLAT